MHQLSIKKMKEFVSYVAIEKRHVPFIWGGFGVGKSVGIKQAALEYVRKKFGPSAVLVDYKGRASLDFARQLDNQGIKGCIFCDVRLSQYDSVDLRGFPGIDEDTETTVWRAPSTLPFEDNCAFDGLDDWLIFVFFDEANSATSAVSAVAYQITNDRRCGEHVLRDNVALCMAGNRETDRGVVNKQPAPLSNRVIHAEAVASAEELALHAQANNWPPVFTAFINFRKALVNTYDPAKPEKTVATPRTWEKAMEYYADTLPPEDIRLAAIAGAVGDGPCSEFYGFVQSWAQIAKLMPAIVKDPAKADIPDEPSLQYAVSVACSGAMDRSNADIYNTYLMRMEPEFGILAWQLGVARDPKLFETKEFVTFSKKYKVVFA